MKKKMKLENLEVQSFVTNLNNSEARTIQGGDRSANPYCATAVAACINTQACTAAQLCGTLNSDACPTILANCTEACHP